MNVGSSSIRNTEKPSFISILGPAKDTSVRQSTDYLQNVVTRCGGLVLPSGDTAARSTPLLQSQCQVLLGLQSFNPQTQVRRRPRFTLTQAKVLLPGTLLRTHSLPQNGVDIRTENFRSGNGAT